MSLGPVPTEMIETAISGPTTEARALATQAIGRMVRDLPLTDSERRLSSHIFDALSRDVTEEVRRALAVTLRLSPNLPRDVANRLINDVDSIAVPILSSSPVVTDDDLIAALESRAGRKAQAVASRNRLSRKVSHAVIDLGDKAAVATLAANDSALISKDDAARMVAFAETDDLIREAALRRQDMPQDLAVRLIDQQVGRVDEALRPDTSDHARIARHTGERSKARWAVSDWSANALQAYVAALSESGGLTETIIGRAAGQGDWRFVQLALAVRAGISPTKAGLMVMDARSFALDALLRQAGLGEASSMLIAASADAFRDLERSGAAVSRERFQRLMAERIASHPASDIFGEIWEDWLDAGLGPQQLPA
ncbi:DUF2336 domain-containing protein [uncultured Algimonas sp.]|uniref:DUF2336 domain-containing protein n=1 Tax=uncultured Algimonas sp. TaxID=1547920 RepID=UPI0026058A1E|nr:DUF2336 domain-containing protein [uncultured Algimonas sp.]